MVYRVPNLGEFLFHLTHVDNISSILQYGILSHDTAYRRGIIKRDVSSNPVQAIREKKLDAVYARPLHTYASLYFMPKNPMLRQLHIFHQYVVTVGIAPHVILQSGTIFTDGNAACSDTRFYHHPSSISQLRWDVIRSNDWESYDDGKRIKCAEVLVYPSVSAHDIAAIFCRTNIQMRRIRTMITQKHRCLPVMVRPDLFFDK